MPETPRTWTLEGHVEGWPTVEGTARYPLAHAERVEVIEKAPMDAERHRMLDLLLFLWVRSDEETHPEDDDCDCEDCTSCRAVTDLLRQHGRLSGGEGS